MIFFFFFTLAVADGFPLESEWQQVSSSLEDFSQYSGRSQQCCSLDGLHSSSYFQVLQFLCQFFDDCNEYANYYWYHCHLHLPSFFFLVILLGPDTYFFFRFLSVLPYGQPEQQSSLFGSFSFLLISLSLVEIRWPVCISKPQRIFCVSYYWTDSGLCIYHLFV